MRHGRGVRRGQPAKPQAAETSQATFARALRRNSSPRISTGAGRDDDDQPLQRRSAAPCGTPRRRTAPARSDPNRIAAAISRNALVRRTARRTPTRFVPMHRALNRFQNCNSTNTVKKIVSHRCLRRPSIGRVVRHRRHRQNSRHADQDDQEDARRRRRSLAPSAA